MKKDKLIRFINGIIGLEQYKEYVLLDHPGTDTIKWLQSKESPKISIPVASPSNFFSHYSPIIKKEELDALKISSQRDAIVLCVITVPKDPKKATANLKAPILINPRELIADQIICENDEYMIKHPIFPERFKDRRCSYC